MHQGVIAFFRRFLRRRLIKRFIRFATIAALAFCVDISVLYLLSTMAGLALFEARLISLPVAASFAWLANRHTTFSDRKPRPRVRQWAHYLSINVFSGIINYGVYVALITASSWMAHHPPVAIVPGGLCGMLINFAGANLWVFRKS